ncbi:glycosyltransferase family 2 protein [Novosphingobium sp. G106]|uniref:glycosyltransferase family 2 protein n=1 Tax=Novosphingobium sp. G106 TaxID=2849500 RepID=UPI001C2DE793|nr:glycosyltransferase family A protein [Novosphingobium sp. G106]MBV1689341.1 glycosyltransferase family 2 protein [Novosphingobium sp. G106]
MREDLMEKARLDREASQFDEVMPDRPTFSVVIPVHNNARCAARAIISALRQSMPVHEIILVDDASCAAEFARLARFVGNCRSQVPVRLERLLENVGAGLARHRGANLASGTHVAFLDADDVWHRHKIREVSTAIVRDEAELVGHRQPWKFKVTRADLASLPSSVRSRSLLQLHFLMLNPILTSSIIVRTSIAREMFRLGGRKAEDYMALVIASRMARRMVFLEAPLAWALKPPFGYAGEGASILANYGGSAINMRLLYRVRVIGAVDLAIFFAFLAARVPIGLVRQVHYRARYAR